MRIATRLLLAVAFLAVPVPVRAQPAAAAPKEGVWRYVDAATVAVARVDLAAYDRGTLEQWLAGIVKANVKDARTVEDVTRGIHGGVVLSYPDQLKRAGAKEAYAVASLSGVPNSVGWLVVPVPAGADVEKIARACFPAGSNAERPASGPAKQEGAAVWRDGSLFAAVVGDVVIFSAGSPERFRQFAAADRPDLAAALAAAGGGALVAAVAPNEDTRKVVEQMMPQLPPPASAPSTVLTRGMRYAALSMDFPPKQKVDLVVQASDASAAGALHDLVVRVLDVPRKDRQFREQFPAAADQIVDALTPKVAGDRLVLSLDAAGVDRVTSLIATGLTKVHERQARMKSLSNLRQLGMGIQLYRNEHEGAFPGDVRQLATYFDNPRNLDQVLVNPLHPERKPGYAYVKPAGEKPEALPAQDTLIMYESFDRWPGRVGVLFIDGHAELIGDQKRFETLLAKAKEGK